MLLKHSLAYEHPNQKAMILFHVIVVFVLLLGFHLLMRLVFLLYYQLNLRWRPGLWVVAG